MSCFVLHSLGKKFTEGKRSFFPFRKVNLTFPDSGLVSIRGKSGSGKSTLLNLLAGFLRPDEGRVLFKGKDITKLKASELEDYRLYSIGMVYQHYNLLEGMTAYENIALPLEMAGKSKQECNKRIHSLAASFHMEHLLDKKIDKDSGGEKQRIAILRALANNPEVILADEPTGALDAANSKLVMEMLKEISKDRLVVMVSHNESLIAEYSDEVFEISGGVINKRKEEAKTHTRTTRILKKRRDGWLQLFTKKHLWQDSFLNLFSFLACLVGFLSLLFSAGFQVGSKKGGEEARWANYEAYTFNVSEKTYQEVDGSPLRLVHSKRPDIEEVRNLLGESKVTIANDYSFFVPDSHAFFLNGKAMEAATFRPISHHDDSLIKEGSYSYGSLIANEEMIREFPSLKVGDEVRFDIPFSLSRYGKKDEGNISFAFILSGIVKEFSFLNSPRFYYDYQLLASKMKETKLENISEALEVETTIESLLSSLPGEDAATNYSYFLFAGDKEEALSIEDIRKKQDESGLSIEGDALASYEAYSSLMNAFLLSLLLFVGIAFLGVFFIVALSSYSSFAKRRKEAAILLALGARKRSVRNIYVQESMLVGALSSVASLSLFPLVTKFVNGYLEKTFSMGSLIAVPYQSFLGVPYLLPMLLLLFALLTSFASTSIALSILRKFPLATVLRDE